MRRKNLVWVLQIIILSVICIIGCEDNNNKPNMEFIYPLSIGNNWQYENIFTLDFDSLATQNGLSDTIYYSSGLVEIIDNEVIFDTLEAFNLKSTLNEDGNIFTGNEYYNNKENCLFSYGYLHPLMMTPKVNQKYAYLIFKNKKFNNVREIINWIKKGYYGNEYSKEDSIIFDPVKSLDYPLEEGKQWIYRTETCDGKPWRIDKKILEWEEIEVPAGKFNCWRIQWFNNPFGSGPNWDEDIVMFDYISEKGLVKRIIEFKNSEAYDAEGNFIGYLDTKDEKILTEYAIE